MQNIFTVLNFFCTLHIHPSLSSNLWQIVIFTVLIVSLFPEGHRVGIIVYSDNLLSLKNMHLRFHVQFLVWEDPLEKEMATHSCILAWRIPWTEEPDRLQSMGSQELDTTKPPPRFS